MNTRDKDRQATERRERGAAEHQTDAALSTERAGHADQTGAAEATERMAHPNAEVDQAAAPASQNHPADPGAAARAPTASPAQSVVAMKQRVDQSGGGDGSVHAFIDHLCDELDQLLERGDIDGAREMLVHVRQGKADFARGLAAR